ncbi:hypothetical protein [Klebsiella spallanzanii]|uniref:Uncharacterized protein n=1 Tax=Klebsiella spallanzanii TaxID=2587528 RepID=A0A564MJJ8_9ENTR|nr:hypothetical protein [Klebsiella spallanzanii]VUS93862.1 hypothetical protein SB6408_05846 [Klebsiella spallanzanii]
MNYDSALTYLREGIKLANINKPSAIFYINAELMSSEEECSINPLLIMDMDGTKTKMDLSKVGLDDGWVFMKPDDQI